MTKCPVCGSRNVDYDVDLGPTCNTCYYPISVERYLVAFGVCAAIFMLLPLFFFNQGFQRHGTYNWLALAGAILLAVLSGVLICLAVRMRKKAIAAYHGRTKRH